MSLDSAGGAAKRSAQLQEMVSRRSSAVTAEKPADSRFAAIKENAFYNVATATSLSLDEKQAETAKIIANAKTRAEMKANVEAMETFKAYVQNRREEMASALLSMVNTGTMAELQATYNDINRDMDQFNKDMAPLLEIIDAVYKIRMSSPTGTLDAYRAIKEAGVKDAERQARRADAKRRFDELDAHIMQLTRNIEAEGTKKTLFGFGGLTPEASANIARWTVDRTDAMTKLSEITNEITAIDQEQSTALGAGTNIDPNALEVLRKMLDLKSEEHTARQKALIQSAINFIKTTKDRVTSITGHLEGQDEKLEQISGSNQQMTGIYAILNEATTAGKAEVLARRAQLAVAPEGETKVAAMERNQELQDIDEYIKRLEITAADTDLTYADMLGGQIRINSMKEANRNQIDKAKAMQTRGVAGVADRLVTTVTAVSTAAINEAQAAARQTAMAMVASTDEIAQQEVIKAATGLDETNEDLINALDSLSSYKEVAETATQISVAAMTDLTNNLEAMKTIAAETYDATQDSLATASKVLAGSGTIKEKGTKAEPDGRKLGAL